MTDRQRNLVVGLTTLAGVTGLIALLMLFGYLPQFLENGYELRVELPRAGGLHPESRILFSGIDIGGVTDVRLQEPPEVGVVVTALIRHEVSIPTDAEISVQRPLLGGGAALEFAITEPLGPDIEFLPTDGTAVVQGEISGLGDNITASLAEPMQKLERLTTAFEGLAAEWKQVGANINGLTQPRSTEAVDKGEAAGNLATVIARMDQRLAELHGVMAGIQSYVGDEQLRTDIRQAAANTRELTATTNQSVAALTEKLVGVADELSVTIASTKATIDAASQPNGTLGKMLADPALYNNLNDAAERLKTVLDEATLLVQKWKAEGLPVQF